MVRYDESRDIYVGEWNDELDNALEGQLFDLLVDMGKEYGVDLSYDDIGLQTLFDAKAAIYDLLAMSGLEIVRTKD